MSTDLDVKKQSEAKIVYGTLCSALDSREWKYNKDENELIVRTSAKGSGTEFRLFIKVDAKRSVMYLKSPMPFTVTAANKNDVAQAVSIANWAMLNGAFETDLDQGYVGFKVVVPFMDSLISEQLCKYMIDISCRMIDAFSGNLQAVANGNMSVSDFAEFAKRAF